MNWRKILREAQAEEPSFRARNHHGKSLDPGKSDEYRIVQNVDGCFLEVSKSLCELVGRDFLL